MYGFARNDDAIDVRIIAEKDLIQIPECIRQVDIVAADAYTIPARLRRDLREMHAKGLSSGVGECLLVVEVIGVVGADSRIVNRNGNRGHHGRERRWSR